VVDLRQTGAIKGIYSLIVISSLVFCVLLNAGCTTPALSRDMTVNNAVIKKKFPYSVSLYVQGGRQSEVGELPQISDEEFKKALVSSITNTKVFARISEGPSDYYLEVIIINISQWLYQSGVHVEIGWRLTNKMTDEIVWQKSIKTSGEAAALNKGDALEAAIKENIQRGLEQISTLEL